MVDSCICRSGARKRCHPHPSRQSTPAHMALCRKNASGPSPVRLSSLMTFSSDLVKDLLYCGSKTASDGDFSEERGGYMHTLV